MLLGNLLRLLRFFIPKSKIALALVQLVIIGSGTPASALSKEAALENCRMSVGRPIVQACMRAGGGSLEACRQKASPSVRSCLMAALNKANGRANVAVAIPAEQSPKIAAGTPLP